MTKVYRSALKDPRFSSQNANDTISLNMSSNIILYKPRTESSGWFTDAHDMIGIKTKETDDELACTDRLLQRNDIQENLQVLATARSVIHNRAISSPFDGSSVKSSQSSMRSYSSASLYSQARTVISDSTKKTLEYRVKAALLRLKEWEEKRVENINDHRIICEHIYEAVTDRITVAKQSLKKLYKFFTERINTERLFIKMSAVSPTLEQSFASADGDSEDWLFPKIFKESDDYQLKYTEKSKIIADFMEEQIIKGVLDIEENCFKEEIDVLVQKYKKARTVLNRENEKATQVTNDYVNLYKKTLTFQKVRDDLFISELQFLKQARIQMLAQKELGRLTALLLTEARRHEASRLQNIGQAMKLYTEAMNQLYGADNNKLVIGPLSNVNFQEEVDKIYHLNRLLRDNDFNVLNQAFATKPEITLDELISYLHSIEFVSLRTNPLLLHECEASLEENGQLLSSKSSNVAITVNRNVVAYTLNPETLDHCIYRKAKFRHIVFKQNKETSNVIEFIETKKKLLINNLKHINIIFRNREDKQVFMDFYQKFSC